MNGNFRLARVLGIPIEINASWLFTIGLVTFFLARDYFPTAFSPLSSHYDNETLHWVLAFAAGIFFFASVLVHELAHSLIARAQSIPVKSITLFIFGGVSQITAESTRPRGEFVMAAVGPLTSFAIAGLLYAAWQLPPWERDAPARPLLQYLTVMNLIVAIFNLLPAFPMDGGRMFRAGVWGLTSNPFRATRVATLLGRGIGIGMMLMGFAIFARIITYFDPWNGLWFAVMGLFIQASAHQAWFQALTLNTLSKQNAAQVMTTLLLTAQPTDRVGDLRARAMSERYIFFVEDEEERVIGVVTHTDAEGKPDATVGEVMRGREQIPVAVLDEDGGSMLQRMEAESVWHLPVVDDGRVVGVVSKDALLRLLARTMTRRPPANSPAGR